MAEIQRNCIHFFSVHSFDNVKGKMAMGGFHL